MLNSLFPNVGTNWPEFTQSIVETIEMVILSGIISLIISLIIAVILVVTKHDGIKPNFIIFNIFDKLINLFRSIPFIILIVALIPLTTLISGTAIGVTGTIFPLVVGITPFFARQIESALNEIDPGLIETGKAIGLSNFQIVKSIYLHEGIISITRMTTTTIVSLIGLTAIVGVVGGGGLGNFAIQYGYQQNQFDVTMACIIVLLILVTIVQVIGTLIAELLTR
ncbi:ABC-type metal ion transport system, permease component [Apilactobacillus kunkeei EFB6]|uniref:ABC-type metal ion transport system, permease component n=1 Tax=Apilactobacillus kunkeei EFB6 TaxID=1419324 RepID=A0A837AE37_9LACO|nr:methionine ABC transporter permease [Apilactobacillus kunkeei]KDB01228.1 ABC-type metal ion transport system, permease component [Apilactobacillus kunkeei EFB6]